MANEMETIDVKISNGGIVLINSVLMGTAKQKAIEEYKTYGYGVKDDGDSIRLGLLPNGILPNDINSLLLDVNDLGDICDGFAYHTHLSFKDAYDLQLQYINKFDEFDIEKDLREKYIKGSVVYSYKNQFFKIEVARFREGGLSPNIETDCKDYAVSVFITSLIEEIRGLAEIKRFLYHGDSILKKSIQKQHKSIQDSKLWYILLCNTLAIIILFVCFLWPSKSTREPAEKKIGRYLYIDNANVLHTKNGCSAVYKERSMQPVEPILKEELNRQSLRRVCSKCVSEKQLDSLRWYVEYTDEGNDIDKDTWD